jgi:hypothetical protein
MLAIPGEKWDKEIKRDANHQPRDKMTMTKKQFEATLSQFLALWTTNNKAARSLERRVRKAGYSVEADKLAFAV